MPDDSSRLFSERLTELCQADDVGASAWKELVDSIPDDVERRLQLHTDTRATRPLLQALEDPHRESDWLRAVSALETERAIVDTPGFRRAVASGHISQVQELTILPNDEDRSVPGSSFFQTLSEAIASLDAPATLKLIELSSLPDSAYELGHAISTTTHPLKLIIDSLDLTASVVDAIFAGLDTDCIHDLELRRGRIVEDVFGQALSRRAGKTLKTLSCIEGTFHASALVSLDASCVQLRTLSLHRCQWDGEGLDRAIDAGVLDALESLVLEHLDLTSRNLEDLAQLVRRARLSRLSLQGSNHWDTEAAASLLRAGRDSLVQVNFQENGLTDTEDPAALVQSIGPRLRGLDLADNHLGEDTALAIANAPNLAQLTWLSLRDNPVGKPGLDALLASSTLSTQVKAQIAADFGEP